MENIIQREVEKLVQKLASSSARIRESALVKLSEQPIENIVNAVSTLLLDDSSHIAQATCLDLLERKGAAVSLTEVRAEGWIDQIGERIDNFGHICTIMGSRFLAYSIILGIQIRSISVDPKFKANTSIEFAIDNDVVQTLPLIEFQTQVVQSILRNKRGFVDVDIPLTVEQAAAVIGGHGLLISPLFDISIEHLILSEPDPDDPKFIIGYISKGGFNFVELDKFDELIKGKVRRDLAGLAEEPFKLDLSAVESAVEAFGNDDFDKVIETLESWPGLLSILNRTPLSKNLEDEKREKIGIGLEILGASFEHRDRLEWSEELYKLGLQFIKDGEIAGKLFARLGLLVMKMERFGEAIGLLRRAIQLGAHNDEVPVALGLCFLRTGKVVPAGALLKMLAREGTPSIEHASGLDEVSEILKSSKLTWDVPSVENR